jgi:hypothetical protein
MDSCAWGATSRNNSACLIAMGRDRIFEAQGARHDSMSCAGTAHLAARLRLPGSRDEIDRARQVEFAIAVTEGAGEAEECRRGGMKNRDLP